MHEMTLSGLERAFGSQWAQESLYVGVAVEIPGHTGAEVIINSRENFQTKLDYYKSAYNEDLMHKHAPGIRIVGYTFANSFEEIEQQLL